MSENRESSLHEHEALRRFMEMSENRESSLHEHEEPRRILDSEMSENRELKQHGHESENIIYTKQLRKGQPRVDFTVSSDINTSTQRNKLLEPKTWKPKGDTVKKPSVKLASANIGAANFINMVDTFDRSANAGTEVTYARSGVYADKPENKPGKRIPKAGAFAEAGVGRAHAEFSVFEAEAKGPNACASAEASAVGAGAMARAEIASASAQAGPVDVKLGLAVDTGAHIGLDGVEVKFLGTGFSFGPKTSVSFLGSEVSCSVM